jgi:hypothetical protein
MRASLSRSLACVALALAATAGCVKKRDRVITVIQQPDPDTIVAVRKSAFALTSSFPSDLVIADRPGLTDVAFVFDGSTVVAVRLGAGALSAATGLSGYTIQTTGVFGDDLEIVDASRGAAVVNNGNAGGTPTSVLEVFNPTTGGNLQNLNLANATTVTAGLSDSAGGTVGSSMNQGDASGCCYVPLTPTTGKLYLSMSNVLQNAPTFELLPGTVQIFAVNWAAGTPVTTTPTVLATTHYNPSHVTPFVDPASGRTYVLVTNTGKYQFGGTINTAGSIDVIDATTDTLVTNIPLGLAAPAFHAIALRQAWNATSSTLETFGLVGAALNGDLYQVNLTQVDALNQASTLPGSYTAGVVNDASNPLAVAGSGDYIPSVVAAAGGRWVFASSFNTGEIRVCDFSTPTPGLNVAPGPFLIGDPANFVSVGWLALRPGNFEGPELFALTGSWPGPDALASVQTSLKVSAP